MDYGFGPNVDSDAISARIKEEGLVQTWIGMQISVVDGGGFGANVDRDAKLMVFDIPTGSSSGVEMDNRFCPNVDTDAILARIKEEGLLMVFDIPTGSSSGVEIDNGFGPNVDSDAILARIKGEVVSKLSTFYGNETGDALKDMELLNAVSSVSSDVIFSDLLYKIKVGVLFLFQSQSTNRKYSVLNFIPKNLWEQFSRFMNQYFLLIACLQLWSLITPVNPASTWACKYMGSFIFIFAVSASKEAWGDCNRYLSDKKQTRNKSGLLDKVEAQDIHVRNIVWLRENDEVPCDLVLIGTSDPLGLCYIETAALDGETDLKTRSIPSTCMGIPFDLLYKIKGVIECPKPDKDIRRFDANLRLFPPFIDNDLMVLDIPTGSSSGVEMDYGFGPNVDSDAISARIKEEGLLMVLDIPTGSSSGVEMDYGFGPNVGSDAISARIKEEGLVQTWIGIRISLMVFDIPTGSSSGVEMDNGFGPNVDSDAISTRIKEEGLVQTWIGIQISVVDGGGFRANVDRESNFGSWWFLTFLLDRPVVSKWIMGLLMVFDIPTGSSSGVEIEYILTDKTETLTGKKMIFRRCINGVFYGNETGDALKDMELLNAVSSVSSDVIM
ncbi:hypothetical protein ACFE04_002318 [Oxalis oulophora]